MRKKERVGTLVKFRGGYGLVFVKPLGRRSCF